MSKNSLNKSAAYQILEAKLRGVVLVGLGGILLSLAACSMLEEDRINYKSASKGKSLEVPPDLTQLEREGRYSIPSTAGTVSVNELEKAQQRNSGVMSSAVAVKSDGKTAQGQANAYIERMGGQRYVVVQQPAAQVWPITRSFWEDNGFVFTLDDQRLGIMETDWAENRAKIPQDFIRKSLGKVLDSLYETGERDKFRTRLESVQPGVTEIYITHKGMREEFRDGKTAKDSIGTVWVSRDSDPELEAEFMRRLVLVLNGTQNTQAANGKNTTKVSNAPAAAEVVSEATLKTNNGQTQLQVNDGFDRAWRRVGLALDRIGFTVEDRDRSKGIYFVRYVGEVKSEKDKGFFSKMFSSSDKKELRQYRVIVKEQDSRTSLVSIQDTTGAVVKDAEAQTILKILAEKV